MSVPKADPPEPIPPAPPLLKYLMDGIYHSTPRAHTANYPMDIYIPLLTYPGDKGRGWMESLKMVAACALPSGWSVAGARLWVNFEERRSTSRREESRGKGMGARNGLFFGVWRCAAIGAFVPPLTAVIRDLAFVKFGGGLTTFGDMALKKFDKTDYNMDEVDTALNRNNKTSAGEIFFGIFCALGLISIPLVLFCSHTLWASSSYLLPTSLLDSNSLTTSLRSLSSIQKDANKRLLLLTTITCLYWYIDHKYLCQNKYYEENLSMDVHNGVTWLMSLIWYRWLIKRGAKIGIGRSYKVNDTY